MRPHKKLEVWKNAMELAKSIYKVTELFPSSEQFGLAAQMRRAAVSIPSNLAEGAARSGKKEFLQFINIAQGSISELDTQIELAKELGFISQKDYDSFLLRLTVLSKQLYGLTGKIRSKNMKA